MKTAGDEITVVTDHPWSDEWKHKGKIACVKLKPDLVWLWCEWRDSGGQWRKVVVDVKVTSTDNMNEAFKEKDEKNRSWATSETRAEGGQGSDDAPHHLPRRGGSQGHLQAMEGLRT